MFTAVIPQCDRSRANRGRMIDAILTNTLLPRVSHGLLERMVGGATTTRVTVSVADGDLAYAFD